MPAGATLDSWSLYGLTVEDTLTLESNVTAANKALAGCVTNNLMISDNVTLGKEADTRSYDSSGNLYDGTVKDTITIGRNVTIENGDLDIRDFTGTLILVEGATLPTIADLFGGDSHYTLQCDKGAILDHNIPKNVKVKYRR